MQILDGSGKIATAHAELDGNITATVLAIDHECAIARLYVGDLADRNATTVSRGQQDALNGIGAIAKSFGKADGQIEPAVAFNDLGDGCATDRGLNSGIDICRCETIACSLGAVDADEQAGLAANAKDTDIRDASNRLHDLRDLVGEMRQRVEIIAKQLERVFPLDAGHRFFHVVLDILGKVQVHAWDL